VFRIGNVSLVAVCQLHLVKAFKESEKTFKNGAENKKSEGLKLSSKKEVFKTL
jgi:hypothetical protein